MTRLSKISRSIIVVMFVVTMVFFEYQNIMIGVKGLEGNLPNGFVKIPGWGKVLYVFSIILLVILYAYIKEKLYKNKVKRVTSLIIRYIYLVVIGSGLAYITLLQVKQGLSIKDQVIAVVLSVITGVLIRKIVFNVSKSDALSVIGMFAYVSIIDILNFEEMYISKMSSLLIVATILFMQIVIDEIKQRGIKNNKYLIFSVLMGVCMAFSVIIGIHASVYVLLAILIFFIGSNLDNAHITFPRKALEDISKEKREFLFKIERINISKLLISVLVTLIVASVILVSVFLIINNTSLKESDDSMVSMIVNNFKSSLSLNISFSFSVLIENLREIIIMSKTYYFLIILYILFMEVLAFVLRRSYDTKSTSMKVIFIGIILSITLFGLNVQLYQPVITTLLILIAIVNTSNIYLNREERVKLLVAGN